MGSPHIATHACMRKHNIEEPRHSSQAKENNDLAQRNQTCERKKNMIKITEHERKKLPFVDIAPPVAHPPNEATIYFSDLKTN